MNKKDKPTLLWFTMKRKGLDVEYPYNKKWLFRQPWGDFILTMVISTLVILGVVAYCYFFMPQRLGL